VAFLEAKMRELKPLLLIESQKTDSTMKQLAEQSSEVAQREAVVSEEAAVIDGQKGQISLMIDEVNKELEKVLPLLR
jgi:hypothetical protein